MFVKEYKEDNGTDDDEPEEDAVEKKLHQNEKLVAKLKSNPVLYMMVKENSTRIKAKRAKDQEDMANGITPVIEMETNAHEDMLNHQECGSDWYAGNDSSDEEKFDWLKEALFDDQLLEEGGKTQDTPHRRKDLQMVKDTYVVFINETREVMKAGNQCFYSYGSLSN